MVVFYRSMDPQEFLFHRKKLQKTQKQLAALLGTSLKAIHSYEQGWRKVPAHVERQLLFLVSQGQSDLQSRTPCWSIKDCPATRKMQCPAWELRAGTLCWFVNGTICEGRPQRSWEEKMETCRKCEVFIAYFQSQERQP